jgi:DNA polymerase-3 subunit epsilon
MTGITNKMLEDAPSLFVVLPTFIDFVGSDIIVGHNVNFDINFIYDACDSLGLPSFSNDFVDTMRLARRMYKGLPNHKLDTLIDHFSLERRTLHRGLGDCELTAECFQHMIADADAFEEAIKVVHRKRYRETHSLKELVAAEGYENPDSPLFGKVCVFTGALESFTRKEAAQLVVNIGGIVGDNVTKKTNFLILGNNDYCQSIKDGKSSKQKKAEKLIAEGADLSIIPESVFLDILYEDDGPSEEPKVEAEEVVVKPDADKMEQEAFEIVAPALKEMLVADNLSADYLFFKQSKTDNAQYSSAYLFNENSLFCRISFRGKQNYFSVPSKYEELIPSDVEYKIQKSDPNYCRILIASPGELANHLELLKKILELQVDAYPSDFGCCSRYEACSDAMKCIHPNPDMALRCTYRKNMKKGRIFYGKNKNI